MKPVTFVYDYTTYTLSWSASSSSLVVNFDYRRDIPRTVKLPYPFVVEYDKIDVLNIFEELLNIVTIANECTEDFRYYRHEWGNEGESDDASDLESFIYYQTVRLQCLGFVSRSKEPVKALDKFASGCLEFVRNLNATLSTMKGA